MALVIAAFFFNSVLAKRLPLVEGLVLLVHVCGVFAIMIPLWALSPRKSAHQVFTEFTNNGGWPSTGVSFMVGLTSITGSMAGIDSVVHMGQPAPAILPLDHANLNTMQLRKSRMPPRHYLAQS